MWLNLLECSKNIPMFLFFIYVYICMQNRRQGTSIKGAFESLGGHKSRCVCVCVCVCVWGGGCRCVCVCVWGGWVRLGSMQSVIACSCWRLLKHTIAFLCVLFNRFHFCFLNRSYSAESGGQSNLFGGCPPAPLALALYVCMCVCVCVYIRTVQLIACDFSCASHQ